MFGVFVLYLYDFDVIVCLIDVGVNVYFNEELLLVFVVNVGYDVIVEVFFNVGFVLMIKLLVVFVVKNYIEIVE